MSTGSKVGIWLVRKHPRRAARVGMTLARHPKRTAAAVKVGRAAPDIMRKARDAKDDPRLRDQMVETRDALTKAGNRLRGSNDLASAATDEKLWSELRRAATAMAAGYAAAQAPKPKRRRRLRRLVLTAGVIGAGAYAGYRATRGMNDQP
ncbi:MAG TPA: hypothetical protein VFX13_05035 [Gaiellales bacterium]|nr:hypothetical protein [Gaiellales bacterium]